MVNLLSERNPLKALGVVLPVINIPCTMRGELKTILTFDNAPLSYALRIVGGHFTTIVRVIKDHENVSHERDIRSEGDLQSLCFEILAFLDEKASEKVSGSFRPIPLRDEDLLGLLRCPNGPPGHDKFREASRMVGSGHLLDAVTEFLTPFGVQPEEIDGSFVKFHGACLKQGEMPGLRIYRFSKFASKTPAPSIDGEEEYVPLDLGKCVVMVSVQAHDAEQEKADQDRRIGHMLRQGGYINDSDDEFSRKALLYDLSKPDDVFAMVKRVLLMRDSQRGLKTPFEMSNWLGKQENRARLPQSYPDPISRPRAYAYWLRQNADGYGQVPHDGGTKRTWGTSLGGDLRCAVLINEQAKLDAILNAKAEEEKRKGGQRIC